MSFISFFNLLELKILWTLNFGCPFLVDPVYIQHARTYVCKFCMFIICVNVCLHLYLIICIPHAFRIPFKLTYFISYLYYIWILCYIGNTILVHKYIRLCLWFLFKQLKIRFLMINTEIICKKENCYEGKISFFFFRTNHIRIHILKKKKIEEKKTAFTKNIFLWNFT